MQRRPQLVSAGPVALLAALALTVGAAPAAAPNRATGGQVPRTVAVRGAGPGSTVRLVGWTGAAVEAAAPGFARDISFPQCGVGYPSEHSAGFGILGTNGGISFSRNPCLVSELAWAKRMTFAPAFYANTGDPGPKRAHRWPIGQNSPKACRATAPNSVECSYDYGWNAAWHSFGVAADAAQRLHHVSRANARARAANVDWWLDVETMNSWQSREHATNRAGQVLDVAALIGEVDALRIAGVDRVGVYSTPYQWKIITGGRHGPGALLGRLPQWLAGYGSKASAIAGCGDPGFTGGPVRMTQYLGRDGYDADVLCSGPGT